jgi:hypothetical protein
MQLEDLRRAPKGRDLLVFGFSLPLIFGGIGYAVYSKGAPLSVAVGIWAFGAVVSLSFALARPLRLAIYRTWMYAVFPIGWTVTRLIMGLLFFAVITPAGLLLRLFGRDALSRRLDPSARSYWVERRQSSPVERYFHQY